MSRYDDILNLPHYEPKHRRMSLESRAAQFAPFAALTGHGAAIAETVRPTESMNELSKEEQARLSLRLIQAFEKHFNITITYFLPDRFKTGGKYERFQGVIKKIDESERMVVFHGGVMIPLDVISDIRSASFEDSE
ncbi:MAG: YolD-like family protein [Bacteroides sp.]|nr:YolD-like family protein [Bacteroides sp.]